jgi:hypothetical protein
MALRVGGAKPAPMKEEEVPVEEPIMEEMPEELPMEEVPMEEPMSAGGMLDPMIAGYKGPEMGPFMCGNCMHFNGDGSCQILSGPVDEAGLCNVFSAIPQEEMPMEEEAPMEEELPVEEPELPEEVVE